MLLSEAKRILRKNGYKIMDEGLFSKLFGKKEAPVAKKPAGPVKKECDPAEMRAALKELRGILYEMKTRMYPNKFQSAVSSDLYDAAENFDASYFKNDIENVEYNINYFKKILKNVIDSRKSADAERRANDAWSYDRAREASEESRIRTGIGRR